MAASPGRSTQSVHKQAFEVKYISRLREIAPDELLNILSYDKASTISNIAETNSKFSDLLDDSSEEIKYNTAIYDDGAEDYIFNQTLEELIAKSRKTGDHESAEDVRILRSARAVIYYTLKGSN